MPRVLSLEVDAAHVLIARNVLAFAGLAHKVQIVAGHSEDMLPWIIERLKGDCRRKCIDFAFLDQRGSRYEKDLSVLQRSGLLRHGSAVVADNVLKPGAPMFLWSMSQNPCFST